MEDLTSVAKNTERSLAQIWDRLGAETAERDEHLSELYTAVRALYDAKIQEQQKIADDISSQIAAVRKECVDTTVAVYGPNSTEVEALQSDVAESEGTLRELLSQAQETKEQIAALRNERSQTISDLFAKLYKQWKLLGGSDGDNFARQFDSLVICNRDEREKDLTLSRIEIYQKAITKASEESSRRSDLVKEHASHIQAFWDELKMDRSNLSHPVDEKVASNNIDASTALISQLEARIVELQKIKDDRKARIQALADEITAIWDLLKVDAATRAKFSKLNEGCGLDVINNCEKELTKRKEEKKAQLKVLIMEMREALNSLWTQLFTDAADRKEDFPAAFDNSSQAFTEEQLAAHDMHVAELEKRVEAAGAIIQMIQERDTLLGQQAELEAAAHDPDRLKSRKAGLLLLEESKIRGRIQKRLPLLLKKLKVSLQSWKGTMGAAFKYQGRDCLQEIEDEEGAAQADEEARRLKAQLEAEARKESLGISARSTAAAPVARKITTSKSDPAASGAASSTIRRTATTGTTTAKKPLAPKNGQASRVGVKPRVEVRPGRENAAV